MVSTSYWRLRFGETKDLNEELRSKRDGVFVASCWAKTPFDRSHRTPPIGVCQQPLVQSWLIALVITAQVLLAKMYWSKKEIHYYSQFDARDGLFGYMYPSHLIQFVTIYKSLLHYWFSQLLFHRLPRRMSVDYHKNMLLLQHNTCTHKSFKRALPKRKLDGESNDRNGCENRPQSDKHHGCRWHLGAVEIVDIWCQQLSKEQCPNRLSTSHCQI